MDAQKASFFISCDVVDSSTKKTKGEALREPSQSKKAGRHTRRHFRLLLSRTGPGLSSSTQHVLNHHLEYHDLPWSGSSSLPRPLPPRLFRSQNPSLRKEHRLDVAHLLTQTSHRRASPCARRE